MRKGLFQRDFLERGQAEDLQNFVHWPFAAELFTADGEQHVDADGDPDLGLHGILGGAEEAFDTEVLLDPFEEKFDLPAVAIELGNGEGGQLEVVGEEDEFALVFGVGVVRGRTGTCSARRAGRSDRCRVWWTCRRAGVPCV